MRIKWNSLFVQISLYFFVTGLLLLLLFGWVMSRQMSALILKKSQTDTVANVQRSAAYLDVSIKRLKKIAEIMATAPLVRTFAEEDRGKAEVIALLKDLLATDEYLLSGLLVTWDGRLLTNEPYFEMATSPRMLEEKWYREAILQQQMAVISSAQKQGRGESREDWVLSVSQEIVSATGENLGVFRVDVAYDALAAYLEQLDLGRSGHSFILSHKGDVIYAQNTAAYSEPAVQRALQQLSQLPNGLHKATMELVTHQTLQESNWQLTTITSLEELAMVSQRTRQMLWLVGALLLVIVFLGSLLVIRQLTRPLKHLEQRMAKLSLEKPVDVAITGSTEVRSLARSYNLMLAQLSRLMSESAIKEQQMRQYELQSLASQINPHFLYNTLETIIWMAEFNDGPKVIEITQSLAKFFRLALNQGAQMIALRDEIEHVRQYLFIQKQRYGQQLNYEIKEEPLLADFRLPKLIVQPLVENALYHGIKESPRKGRVRITTSLHQGQVLIVVADNGRGYEPFEQGTGAKLGGVGLKNIDQRLRLQYGEAYHMTIESQVDSFTRVSLYLPLSHKTSAS